MARLLGVGDAPELSSTDEVRGIPDLAAHLMRVEASRITCHLVLRSTTPSTVAGVSSVVSDKARRRLGLDLGQLNDSLLTGEWMCARAVPPSTSRSLFVHSQYALAGHQPVQIQGGSRGSIVEENACSPPPGTPLRNFPAPR